MNITSLAMRLKVIVRVRPLSLREKQNGSQSVVAVENDNHIAVTNIKVPEQHKGDSRKRVRRFAFDYCLSEEVSQNQIFERVENLVGTSLKNRQHSCVLAYGQTSSGKTYTMMGNPQDPGLTPRLCRRIFNYFEEGALSAETVQVSISYFEIYNEKVADLLTNDDKCGQIKPLKVREHPKKGPYVEGLSQELVTTDLELLERLEAGTRKRRVGSTTTNSLSSRSHSVFSISCDGVTLHLLDLAGNERAGSRGYGPSRFREGANINKSLVALGTVISTLADHSKTSSNTRNKFVPYRDSVLTWLLKDTLQGNSNTVMIATVSPSNLYYSETLNTLRFGQRAKHIIYKPVIVEDSKEGIIRELRLEIARLRELLKLSYPTSEQHLLPTLKAEGDESSELQNSSTTLNSSQEDISLTETLIPTMSVQSSISEDTIPIKLKRIDRSNSIETDRSKSFSSQESLQSPKRGSRSRTSSSASSSRRLSSGSLGPPSVHPKQTALSLKRQAINKNIPLLKSITQRKLLPPPAKMEKGVVTDLSGLKGRKQPSSVQPRAQIVAAVTSRLYNKVKKLDVGTSTESLNAKPELSICSNARNRLRDLTRKALKAHRSKSEETQTDLFPILRVKEVSTDCTDLKTDLGEAKDAFTAVERELRDAEVDCSLLGQFDEPNFKSILLLTRSCGSQTTSSDDKSSVSFTKYLLAEKNPIFAEAVNISISHNYLSQSDDSLESQQSSQRNYPTPDLISNHNSLEEGRKVLQADCIHLQGENLETAHCIPSINVYSATATMHTVPCYRDHVTRVEIVAAQAAQNILPETSHQDGCSSLPDFCPKFATARTSKQANQLSHHASFQPEVHFIRRPCASSGSSTSNKDSDEESNSKRTSSIPPDSLDYHLTNQKKVPRGKKTRRPKGERLMKAMKDFLQEAKVLMSNIAENRPQCQQPHLDDFDIQVTLNDVHVERPDGTLKSTQTAPVSVASSCSQTSLLLDEIWSSSAINKYEALLEDSCKRLQEKINKCPRSRHISLTSEDLYKDEVLFAGAKYNPWDLSNEIEDSSLDSQPATFSDYGSLPRKTHKRHRTPTCSPSVFLKQLTEVRRQVIEHSREELQEGNSSN